MNPTDEQIEKGGMAISTNVIQRFSRLSSRRSCPKGNERPVSIQG